MTYQDCKDSGVVRLEIPIPPSSNNIFVNAWGKRRGKTKEYAAWCGEVDLSIKAQRPVSLKPPVAITVTIYGGKGFIASGDISNRIKAAEDAVVRAGIVPDDNIKNVHRVTAQYYPPRDKKSVARAVVLIQELEDFDPWADERSVA